MKTKNIFISIVMVVIFNNPYHCQSQWVKTSNAPATNINIYCLEKNGSTLFAGTQNGIFSSTDNGNNWTLSGLGDKQINTMTTNGSYIFAGTYDDVYFSTNNGASWQVSNHHNNGLIYFNISALAVSGSNIYVGANGGSSIGGVYFSTNNATSWTPITAGLGDKNIQSLATINSYVFAGTLNDGVYLTTNNALWNFAGLTSTGIKCLAVIGTNLFAATATTGISLSTNYGSNWASVNTGLTNLTINAMITSGTNIFVGTSGSGVFLSTDNGSNWTRDNNVNLGLTEPNIKTFTILGSNLFLATGNGNIWWRPLSAMITNVEDNSNSLPINFSLQQNYPNPFNPTTKIKFGLKENAFTKLIVYDLLGREVETLIDRKLIAGYHEIEFNASSLTSGIYFYKIQAGEFFQTKKMILLK